MCSLPSGNGEDIRNLKLKFEVRAQDDDNLDFNFNNKIVSMAADIKTTPKQLFMGVTFTAQNHLSFTFEARE